MKHPHRARAVRTGGIGGVNGLGTVATLGNTTITPELKEQVEFGVDLQAFNSRVAVKYTHFDARVRDALLLRNLPNLSVLPTVRVGTVTHAGV